jgi:hypothetical protein
MVQRLLQRLLQRRLALVLTAIWLAVIAGFTLIPLPRQLAQAAATPWYCVVCGDQGTVDVLLNVALFVPLGLGLGVLGVRPIRALLAGLVLALVIELLQATLVTGRDPSLSDVLTNGCGSFLGAALAVSAPGLWRPSVASARQLAISAALGWLLSMGITGWLLTEDKAAGPVRLVQAPTEPFLERFSGSIQSARADEGSSGRSLHASIVTVGITDRLAPVLELRDADRYPLALLGQLGQKPVFSWRLRATRALLRTPAVRVYGGVFPDAPVPASLDGGKTGPMLWAAGTVDGQRHTAELALTPGLGWMLLLPLNYPFDVHSRWTSAAWLALPLLLVGFWAGRARMRFALLIVASVALLLAGLEGTAAMFHLARDGALAWGVGLAAVIGAWGLGREAYGMGRKA